MKQFNDLLRSMLLNYLFKCSNKRWKIIRVSVTVVLVEAWHSIKLRFKLCVYFVVIILTHFILLVSECDDYILSD